MKIYGLRKFKLLQEIGYVFSSAIFNDFYIAELVGFTNVIH